MALGLVLQQKPQTAQKQQQKLSITPQLSQAIKLLAMSNAELSAFIDSQIENNPLLERKDTNKPEQALSYANSTGSSSFEDMEDRRVAPVSLHEYLRGQLALLGLQPEAAHAAKAIIEALGPCGYFRDPLPVLAADLGISLKTAETALESIQTLEPHGIGARDLAECLALQLRVKNRLDPAMEILLKHLDKLGERDFASLKRLTGLDESDLLDALADIRACNPKPGTAFENTQVQSIQADIHIAENRYGGWDIRLDHETLPKVLIDRTYAASLSLSGRSNAQQEARAFTQKLRDDASWLIRSLDQRANTILSVVTEIARQQDAFLRHGISHLRPMTLQQVADAIGMHESTVSRVTSNKYVATPRGLFELKYFFTSTIGAGTGESHSSNAVKERIRALITAESPKNVYSDDGLVAALKAENIEIARRTVAKYRESMQIPSSVQRKREKRAAAKAMALVA